MKHNQFYHYFTIVLCFFSVLGFSHVLSAQAYFYGNKGNFDSSIPTPERFLGYPIGSQHTRHDQLIAYMRTLAEASPKATLQEYARTYEGRPLTVLTITSVANHAKLQGIKAQHEMLADPSREVTSFGDIPVLINLGYNVHGNEPSSSEAAMLTAYYFVASTSEEVKTTLEEAVIMIDPVINPDGRDRHTHWANMHKGNPLVTDPLDREHNEVWPGGRTNHYWFDLNRDWLLAVHPESRGKLNFYHQWLPNVVTDFHEMGTNSTYFFEPMKVNGSKNPIMPKENYTTLNETFAGYFSEALDNIGSFYFTKEAFDGTYPGYGSSYPDVQGGLGLLFEQASSRGHAQDSENGIVTFAFTIRNQFTSSLATVKASVAERETLLRYKQNFFKLAISNAQKDPVKAYIFGDDADQGRNRAFLDLLLMHRIKVYEADKGINTDGKQFPKGKTWVVPTNQPQYRMVQTMFESYKEYQDSVFYDASAWSLINAYGLPFGTLKSGDLPLGSEVTFENNKENIPSVTKSNYAYLIEWSDYYSPKALYYLQSRGVRVKGAFKKFTAKVDGTNKEFGYGTLMVPVSYQSMSADELYLHVKNAIEMSGVKAYNLGTGYSISGVDLGSRYFVTLDKPKAIMPLGEGISSYEAGEIWHLLETRVAMPITKVDLNDLSKINWPKYNTLVMVSGNYDFDSAQIARIKQWVADGGTLITQRTATEWAIKNGLVKEKLRKIDHKEEGKLPYVDAPDKRGAKAIGGTIFETEADLTHPLAFGYTKDKMRVYRNSSVILEPSENAYSTVLQYTQNPHIDGFVSTENLEKLKGSASLIVSKAGRGRVIMFADNPNFRGTWYGTNRLFFNALFYGSNVQVPSE